MYFCKGHDYWGNVDLSKGYWNPKKKMWVTTHFSKIIKQPEFQKKRQNTKNVWQFLSKFKLSYLWKMRGYPQFSSWILIALAKSCFFRI